MGKSGNGAVVQKKTLKKNIEKAFGFWKNQATLATCFVA